MWGEESKKMIGTAGVEHKYKNITMKGKTVKVDIWDTAGLEKYRASHISRYHSGASGMLLIFDLTDKIELENLDKFWLP